MDSHESIETLEGVTRMGRDLLDTATQGRSTAEGGAMRKKKLLAKQPAQKAQDNKLTPE